MIVAVDIGNSNIVIGINQDDKWVHLWRMPTNLDVESAYFYDVEIRNRIFEHDVDVTKTKGIILSTVVPSLRDLLVSLLYQIFKSKVVVVGPKTYEDIKFEVPRPYEIGTDLVANAYSAYKTYRKDCIVVDFGTALTFTTVTKEGELLGVAIAPGLKTAMKALSSSTAQLPEIPLQLPQSAIGKNTTHAIQAGILWGYVGMTKELLEQIRSEVGSHYIAVATGGLSFVMKPLKNVFYDIDPWLTLNGLKLMFNQLLKK